MLVFVVAAFALLTPHTVRGNLATCQAENESLRDQLKNLQSTGTHFADVNGATYTRWGRLECGTSGDIVYKGVVGGSYYTHAGNGANYLCLPKDPQYANTDTTRRNRGLLYGAEYQMTAGLKNFPFETPDTNLLTDQDAVCVVCQTRAKQVLMIPARTSCYTGWTLEYRGYLATNYYGYQKTEFLCLDAAPVGDAGGAKNDNGALFYPTEGVCGSLPCPPYRNYGELSCVVCVK